MKVLMIGLGGIGQRHLRNLRALLGTELEVIAHRVRRQQFVLTEQLQVESDAGLDAKYGVRVFSELAAALAERPAAAFICNPSSLHGTSALASAAAGCHLFVEKPVTDSLADAEALVAAVQGRGLVGFVGYQLRFHPCFQQMQAWVESGSIGQVIAVRAEVGEYLPGWHPYEDYRQMYASRRVLGGGVILSQIHEFDYLYALFGRPRKVFAVGGKLSRLEVDVEDVASVLMEFGPTGFPVHLHQDYVQRPPARSCQIVGNNGKIQIDFRALSATRWDEGGAVAETATFPALERNALFLAEMRHFLACVAGTETPLVSLADGAESLRVALAARASLESGAVVVLPPR